MATMKKKSMRQGSALLLLLLPMLVTASDLSWYIAGRTSIGRMVMKNADHDGSVGTGVLIQGVTDGEFLETTKRDYSNGIGGAVGFDRGSWRFESELLWRYRSDWDLTAPTPSTGKVTLFRTNYGTTTLFLNAMRRGAIARQWSWEAGAGIGLIRKVYESEFYLRGEQRDLPTDIQVKDRSTETDFGWQLLAGIRWQFGERWSAHLRYRHADFGDLHAGPFGQRSERVEADLDTHEATLGFERSL